MSENTQRKLIDNFFGNLAPHLPFIHTSNLLSPQSLDQNHPTLLLAILAASAASVEPPLGRDLALKLENVYASQVLANAEKSPNMVQAFLITASWYHPPDQFKDLKFTHYAHTAANMALDLHIGDKDTRLGCTTNATESEPFQGIRTLIACYLLCSG
jgi:hypothetical protein